MFEGKTNGDLLAALTKALPSDAALRLDDAGYEAWERAWDVAKKWDEETGQGYNRKRYAAAASEARRRILVEACKTYGVNP